MPFQVSPGVNVREIDLTTVVPAVATSEGAIAGVFRWGPVNQRTLVDSEVNLVQRFGTPTNFNQETWFTAASFLGYGNRLYVVRGADVTGNTTTKTATGDVANTTSFDSTAVANTTDFISIASNPFTNSDIVVYTVSAGKTPLSGLDNGETYFVVQANSTGIKLAATEGGSNIDISTTSTNATFNSQSGVNDTDEFITISSNPYVNGDIVTYIVDAGNTAITGISNGASFFIVQANSSGVKLSLTSGGAPIDISNNNISETGHTFVSGSGHTLSRSLEFVMTSGNGAFFVGNTSGVVNGMVLVYSNNSGLITGSTVTVVNATHMEFSDPAENDIQSLEVVVRENIPYTAVAVEGGEEWSFDWDSYIVENENNYTVRDEQGEIGSATVDSVRYIARFPGDIGNSIRISVCDTASQFNSTVNLVPNAQIAATSGVTANVGSNTVTITISPANTGNATHVTSANVVAGNVSGKLSVGDLIEVGNTRIGTQTLKVTNVGSVAVAANVYTILIGVEDEYKLAANVTSNTLTRYWEFYNSADKGPGQSTYVANFGNTAAADELHVVVVDEGGKVTGSPGTIIEVYRNLSRATDAKSEDGGTIYYKEVINEQSQYIWWTSDRDGAASATAQLVASSTETSPLNTRFYGGSDGPNETNVPFATLAFGYDLFRSAEDVDISLVLQGKARGTSVSAFTQLGNYIIDNITEQRKDCVAFISPDRSDVVNNIGSEAADIVDFRSYLRSTSYAVMDSGYKYIYDKYNDVYRYVPLNGDVAGLCARTDSTNDPWFSPAGLNRGQIRNIIKLAFNPRKSERDTLYKDGVNPVVTFPGQGTVLFGDKTLLAKPSAFDRINVRRLFIVLEKAISTASKFTLFEFNDTFTRSQFRNLITPFLRDVQGRRGITDFLVVCDDSNNTPEVIDRNEFIGDIYIKPARSINFIQLNFVAVRTGVAFSEVVGRF
jgi:hypothetical protein